MTGIIFRWSAIIGWAAVVAVVIAADLKGELTMSEVFRSAARHKVSGPVLAAVWLTLTLHLFGLLPPERDPFHVFIEHGRVRIGIRIAPVDFES